MTPSDLWYIGGSSGLLDPMIAWNHSQCMNRFLRNSCSWIKYYLWRTQLLAPAFWLTPLPQRCWTRPSRGSDLEWTWELDPATRGSSPSPPLRSICSPPCAHSGSCFKESGVLRPSWNTWPNTVKASVLTLRFRQVSAETASACYRPRQASSGSSLAHETPSRQSGAVCLFLRSVCAPCLGASHKPTEVRRGCKQGRGDWPSLARRCSTATLPSKYHVLEYLG